MSCYVDRKHLYYLCDDTCIDESITKSIDSEHVFQRRTCFIYNVFIEAYCHGQSNITFYKLAKYYISCCKPNEVGSKTSS
mmetsp:Transcript_27564/g.27789  ORF Transcript_27564/g.27789 Transcript_27564/m.27789 type:complete len:80 (-) Transcript_27564:56-295(-)